MHRVLAALAGAALGAALVVVPSGAARAAHDPSVGAVAAVSSASPGTAGAAATSGSPSPSGTPSIPGIGTIPAGALVDPTGPTSGLLAQLTDLQTKLQAAQAEQELAAQQLQATTDQLRDADNELSGLTLLIKVTQQHLDEVYARWTLRVQRAYEQGPAWQAAALLTPNPEEVLQQYAALAYVVRQDRAAFDDLVTTRSALHLLEEQAQQTRDQQAVLAAAAQAHSADLAKATAAVQGVLDGTTAQLKSAIDAFEADLETARRHAFYTYLAALGRGGTGTPGLGASTAAQTAVQWALAQLGKPYVFGAAGPDSFDCSGLVMRAYQAAGISLPRVAADQYNVGTHVAMVDLLPGDLVFYATDVTDPATIHHVGMYIGGGLMVNAPHTGAVVRIGSVWQPEYIGAVRVVGGVAGGPTSVGPVPPPPPDIPLPPAAAPASPAATDSTGASGSTPPSGSGAPTPAPTTGSSAAPPGTSAPPSSTSVAPSSAAPSEPASSPPGASCVPASPGDSASPSPGESVCPTPDSSPASASGARTSG